MALLAGVAIGAGTMFLLDPDRGGRRRALIRAKAANLRGILAPGSPDARQLIERVRAELGRVVSHPRAIDVSVLHDGCVGLTGPVLTTEADAVLGAIARVRGVARVEDNLERHATAENVPALQGGHGGPRLITATRARSHDLAAFSRRRG